MLFDESTFVWVLAIFGHKKYLSLFSTVVLFLSTKIGQFSCVTVFTRHLHHTTVITPVMLQKTALDDILTFLPCLLTMKNSLKSTLARLYAQYISHYSRTQRCCWWLESQGILEEGPWYKWFHLDLYRSESIQ